MEEKDNLFRFTYRARSMVWLSTILVSAIVILLLFILVTATPSSWKGWIGILLVLAVFAFKLFASIRSIRKGCYEETLIDIQSRSFKMFLRGKIFFHLYHIVLLALIIIAFKVLFTLIGGDFSSKFDTFNAYLILSGIALLVGCAYSVHLHHVYRLFYISPQYEEYIKSQASKNKR